MEEVEAHFILIQLHLGHSLLQFVFLVFNHLFSFSDFLLFLLQLLNFLVDLLLHHLEQILVLDFQLVHYPPEALLQLLHLLVELLAHFHFKFIIQLLVD